MGFFTGSYKDTSIYPVEKWQKRNLSDIIYRQLGQGEGDYSSWMHGSPFGSWLNNSGLGGLQPGQEQPGQLGFSDLTGGIDFSNPDWMNSLGIQWASPGHADASLVDLNAQPYQTAVDPTVEQHVLGQAHTTLGAQTEQANRQLATQGALSGMSPAAMAYLSQMNQQKAADSLGNMYGQFETSWVQEALQRQAAARQLNAQLETQVSEENAQLSTQASDVNAQLSAGLAQFGANLHSGAAKELLGLWQQGQGMDLQRAQMYQQMLMGATHPVGQMTKQASGLDILGQVAGIAGNLAGAGLAGNLAGAFGSFGGLGGAGAGVGAGGMDPGGSSFGGLFGHGYGLPSTPAQLGPVADQGYFGSNFNSLNFLNPWMMGG